MIHLPWSSFGPFLGTVVGVRWSPTRLKIIKTDTHLPSWMRKFLLEGAFSAISSAYLRACLFRLVYVGGNASLRSANLSEAAVADDIFKNLGIREDRWQLE